jgi:WhiB family transcriptional regulator, redox-sensing transcriptional regulator
MAQNEQRPGSREVDMSVETCRNACKTAERTELPCHIGEPDLWFAEHPSDLEQAKALCVDCPIRRECLAAALEREEPWGVWGGEIIERGAIVARKRPRGRPRKSEQNPQDNPAAA